MHILDDLMRKLLPRTDQEVSSREQRTEETVQTAASHRKDAQSSMIEAYRKAGIQYAPEHQKR